MSNGEKPNNFNSNNQTQQKTTKIKNGFIVGESGNQKVIKEVNVTSNGENEVFQRKTDFEISFLNENEKEKNGDTK